MGFVYRELRKALDDWYIWFAYLMLFIPGILYQLHIDIVDISLYSGTLVIIFLITSFYYSLPFLIQSFLVYSFIRVLFMKKGVKFKHIDFTLMSFISMGLYFIYESFFRGGFSFWEIYGWAYVPIYIVMIISDQILRKRSKTSKRKPKKK